MGLSFPKLQLLCLTQDLALGWEEAGVSMEGKGLTARTAGFQPCHCPCPSYVALAGRTSSLMLFPYLSSGIVTPALGLP